MSSDPQIGLLYRILRALVRAWARLFFRHIRRIDSETSEDSGPAIYVVSHPTGFLDALLLVAAFDRPVRCLVDWNDVRGLARRLFARSLGMIPFETDEKGAARALEESLSALEAGSTVLLSAGPKAGSTDQPSEVALDVAELGLEAESRQTDRPGPRIFPVHLFLPVGQFHANEMLVHVNSPLSPEEILPLSDESRQGRATALARAVDETLRQNSFGLRPEDVEFFLADVEGVLRADLAEDWAARPNWKQSAESFELSGMFVKWILEINRTNPGRLASLRGMLMDYLEAKRRFSLAQFDIEMSGEWIKSAWRQAWFWFESVAEFPIAVFGFLNHLLIFAALAAAGLLKKGTVKNQVWMARAGAVLVFYTAQVFFCAFWWGRAAAGYYALALPASGAILWRYSWLFTHRTRLLYMKLRSARKTAALARSRKGFLAEVGKARDVYVSALGLPV